MSLATILSKYGWGKSNWMILDDGAEGLPARADASGNMMASLDELTKNTSLQTLTAQGAGTVNSADAINQVGRALHLVIDITAISGTGPSLTVTLQGKDSISGKYYTILASAALAAVATTVLRVFPGATAAANTVANDILPRTFRVSSVVAGTGPSVTATIAAIIVP